MIKGIDAQIMTNRATEYTKDVSTLLRRDELSNEFANRLSKVDAEREMRAVNEAERMREKRINADDEGGNQQEAGGGGAQQGNAGKSEPGAVSLPSVGASEQRLLDIEV